MKDRKESSLKGKKAWAPVSQTKERTQFKSIYWREKKTVRSMIFKDKTLKEAKREAVAPSPSNHPKKERQDVI